MQRCWPLFLLGSLAWCASGDWRDVLDRVRENVLHQVTRSANYICTQTVERTYSIDKRSLVPGCVYDSKVPDKKEIMRDRLRLDVEVSEGKEIFAWHGENRFVRSATIDDVVRRGPVSSGEFIGFLENIFAHDGIQFRYTGESTINGALFYLFDYTVPLASSGYHVRTQRGHRGVPFHGFFSVRAADYQLATVEIIPDEIPKDSYICSATTEMNYETLKISGTEALVPTVFVLRINDNTHLYTTSRSEYSQCHAFSAESTLHFDIGDSTPSAAAPSDEQQLTDGTILHIALRTPIEDEKSYTGDPVEGILLRPVKIKGDRKVIAKGSVVEGVITVFEDHFEPRRHYLLQIQFQRIRSGNASFLFRAKPVPTSGSELIGLYGWPLPASIEELHEDGVFVFSSRHVHLDQRFSGIWKTEHIAAPAAGESSSVGR